MNRPGKVNWYETDLEKNAANYVPLTPLAFMERAAGIYPDQMAVVYGPVRRNWAETYARCRRLASALCQARHRHRRHGGHHGHQHARAVRSPFRHSHGRRRF